MAETDEDVPGEGVELDDGRTVYVHPVSHTHSMNPMFRPGEEMKEYIQDSIQEYTEDGAEVYMEQNLPSDYDLDEDYIQEIDDHDWAEQEYSKIWEEMEEEAKWKRRKALASMMTMPLKAPLAVFRMYKKQLVGPSEEEKERREKVQQDIAYLTDPDALEDYEQHSKDQPPEPEQRDQLWEDDPKDAVRRSERSRYIAQHVVENTESDEAHVFVGGGHYTGVLHWLDEYSDGTKLEEDDTPAAHKLSEGIMDLEEYVEDDRET